MDEARKEAKRIFLEATEITSPEARAEFISKACSIDRGLRDRVEQLLDADKKAGQFLAATENLCPEDFEDSGTQPGTHVGPYQLLERIATGGMGVVFVAEQQLPVKRRVALKVIRPGMDSKQVIARFEAERQTLALMEHQNIAKVFDAGTTEQGRPYFVMELVNGIPLTEYCDKHQLTPRERLDLFIPVCHAIQHAHQKGIIHRDVKPSNILVALYDGVAVPKVIDFGIAKAISQPLSEETVFTNFGQIIGTLEYMSPEQTQRNQLDVDTRSDIYSLGVVLYQLLTGTTPFDSQRLRSAGFEEMMRIIREEEPQKPSTKLSSSEDLPAIASSRATDPAKLGSLVRGELDWIVLKAMAKEPQRRYPTAVAFASDLQCYLNNEPVEACPPSRIYYLRKFAKRHRAALAATSVICVALASGIAGTSWQAIRATRALARAERAEALAQTQLENALRERERAESATKNAEQEAHHAAEAKSLAEKAADDAKRENASSQAVLEFLQQDLLGMADTGSLMQAGLAPDPDLRLRTVLDRAAKAVDTRFGDQPTVNASIRMTLGTIYHNLGLFQEAEQHKRMALDLLTANLGNDHLEALEAMDILANTILRLGRNSEALELYEQSKIAKVRLVGENHPAYLQTLAGLAGAYTQMGLVGKALSIEEEILKKRTELLGADHPETLSAQRNLGASLCMAGKPDEGAKLLRESVENYIRIFGKEHPKTLSVSTNLAAALCMIGKIEESIQVAEEAYKVGASVLGETHPEVLRTRTQLAAAYTHTGNHAKAHELLQQVFKAQQETVGMDHPDTMSTLEFMASSHAEAGRLNDAIEVSDKLLEQRRKVLGDSHPDTIRTLIENAGINTSMARFEQARKMLDEASTLATAHLDDKHPLKLDVLRQSVHLLISAGKYRTALSLAEESLAAHLENLGEKAMETMESAHKFAVARFHVGDFQGAIEILERNVAMRTEVLGERHPHTLSSMSDLAANYFSVKNFGESMQLNEKTQAIKLKTLGPDHPQTLRSNLNLAVDYQQLGQYQKGIALLETSVATWKRIAGPRHPRTWTFMDRLAQCHYGAGHRRQALTLAKETLDGQIAQLGANHPKTIVTRLSLASMAYDSGQLPLAVEHYTIAHQAYTSRLSKDHPSTSVTLANLADARRDLGEIDEAISQLTQALKNLETAIDVDNNVTRRVRCSLFATYCQAGEFELARRLFDNLDDPTALEQYLQLLAMFSQGKSAEFSSMIDRMKSALADEGDLTSKHWLLWSQVLRPVASEDYKALIDSAETLRSRTDALAFQLTYAAVLARCGESLSAIPILTELRNGLNNRELGRDELAFLELSEFFLALANLDQKRSEAAVGWFNEANGRLTDREHEDYSRVPWTYEVASRILRQEIASALDLDP